MGALIHFSFSDSADLFGARLTDVSDDVEDEDDPDDVDESSKIGFFFVADSGDESEDSLSFVGTDDVFGLGDEVDDEDPESVSLDEEESSSKAFLPMAAGRFDS